VAETKGCCELYVRYGGEIGGVIGSINMITPHLLEPAYYSAWYPIHAGMVDYTGAAARTRPGPTSLAVLTPHTTGTCRSAGVVRLGLRSTLEARWTSGYCEHGGTLPCLNGGQIVRGPCGEHRPHSSASG
jgi:hypothetical protein